MILTPATKTLILTVLRATIDVTIGTRMPTDVGRIATSVVKNGVTTVTTTAIDVTTVTTTEGRTTIGEIVEVDCSMK
jgi:hypothetical protein